MASLNIPWKAISVCVIAIIAGYAVMADECRTLCGYTAPTTYVELNKSCDSGGSPIGTTNTTINRNDGSFSVYQLNQTAQISVGSCCSGFQSSYYGTGVIIDGRFSGENMIFILKLRDDGQTCTAVNGNTGGCQSSAGLTRVSSQVLLTIGTKGVGDWIECTGNGPVVWSPAVSKTPTAVHTTIQTNFNNCSNCVQSC